MVGILALSLREFLESLVLLAHEALQLHHLPRDTECTLRCEGALVVQNLLTEFIEAFLGEVRLALVLVAPIAANPFGCCG